MITGKKNSHNDVKWDNNAATGYWIMVSFKAMPTQMRRHQISLEKTHIMHVNVRKAIMFTKFFFEFPFILLVNQINGMIAHSAWHKYRLQASSFIGHEIRSFIANFGNTFRHFSQNFRIFSWKSRIKFREMFSLRWCTRFGKHTFPCEMCS